MTEKRLQLGMPGVEFEGPMGMFWIMEDVPMEALAKGAAEIIIELRRRGYDENFIFEAIKRQGSLLETTSPSGKVKIEMSPQEAAELASSFRALASKMEGASGKAPGGTT